MTVMMNSTAPEPYAIPARVVSLSASTANPVTPMKLSRRSRASFGDSDLLRWSPESVWGFGDVRPQQLMKNWMSNSWLGSRPHSSVVSDARTAEPAPSMVSDSQTASESSTLGYIRATYAMFQAAREYHFEDGMESPFSQELTTLVNHDGDQAVQALAGLLIGEQIDAEAAAEALRWLGLIEDPDTKDARRWLLERCLWLPSSRVRDGAVLGLAYMDEPLSLPSLTHAARRELVPQLREDIMQVVAQLEDTRRCQSS